MTIAKAISEKFGSHGKTIAQTIKNADISNGEGGSGEMFVVTVAEDGITANMTYEEVYGKLENCDPICGVIHLNGVAYAIVIIEMSEGCLVLRTAEVMPEYGSNMMFFLEDSTFDTTVVVRFELDNETVTVDRDYAYESDGAYATAILGMIQSGKFVYGQVTNIADGREFYTEMADPDYEAKGMFHLSAVDRLICTPIKSVVLNQDGTGSFAT